MFGIGRCDILGAATRKARSTVNCRLINPLTQIAIYDYRYKQGETSSVNPVGHRRFYSCTRVSTMGVKGLSTASDLVIGSDGV